MNNIMTHAFAVIYYAFSGVIAQFSRLFVAFDLGNVIFPMLLISVIFSFVILPFVHRAHSEAIEGMYLKTKLGREQIGRNITQRKMNNLKWRMTEIHRVRNGEFR